MSQETLKPILKVLKSTQVVNVTPGQDQTVEEVPTEVEVSFYGEIDPEPLVATFTGPGAMGRAEDYQASLEMLFQIEGLPDLSDVVAHFFLEHTPEGQSVASGLDQITELG